MKVVFVTHQFPPRYTTGTELYAERLARRLLEADGIEVLVYTFEPAYLEGPPLVRHEEARLAGLSVTRVCMWPGLSANPALASYYNVHLGKMFGRFLDRVRPDVVHVFHAAFHGISIFEEAALRGIPVVTNLMDFWFVCPSVQLVRRPSLAACDGPAPLDCLACLAHGDDTFAPLERMTKAEGFVPWFPARDGDDSAMRWNQPSAHAQLTAIAERPEFVRDVVLRHAARIVAPSVSIRDVFVAHGYPEDRMTVVRYGVDPMPLESRRRSESTTLRVGYIGSLNPPKGPDVLVDAVRGLDADVSLDLFGDQTMFVDYVRGLREHAEGDDRIRLRGHLPPEEVPRALGAIDVLVVPSLWRENTPFVVLEAQAAGVAVVASDVAGIAEIVRPGVDGLLFPPGDVAALREALRSLAADRTRLAELSGHHSDHRTLLDNARDFARMYEEVTGDD